MEGVQEHLRAGPGTCTSAAPGRQRPSRLAVRRATAVWRIGREPWAALPPGATPDGWRGSAPRNCVPRPRPARCRFRITGERHDPSDGCRRHSRCCPSGSDGSQQIGPCPASIRASHADARRRYAAGRFMPGDGGRSAAAWSGMGPPFSSMARRRGPRTWAPTEARPIPNITEQRIAGSDIRGPGAGGLPRISVDEVAVVGAGCAARPLEARPPASIMRSACASHRSPGTTGRMLRKTSKSRQRNAEPPPRRRLWNSARSSRDPPPSCFVVGTNARRCRAIESRGAAPP